MGRRMIALLAALALVFSLAGCGGAPSMSDEKIVNIGITDSLGGMNPLTIEQTWVNVYAVGLQFLPLVSLDENLGFQAMLADSISTEDNIHFKVHIDEAATWSDGKPVTAADVAYTVLKLASPVIANPTMMYYVFEGVGDDGFTKPGATEISGVKVVDEKTIEFTTKYPISLTTFQNSYASYLRPLPKHILEGYSDEELKVLDWFNHPDVVSGPFKVTEYHVNHFVSYDANMNYWKGAPKIEKLNFKIVDASQIYAGLKTGEIDLTHHAMTAIPQDDYENIEALEQLDVIYGVPVTNQSVFLQTANLTDARVRKAIVHAIDREMIVEKFLKGHGEVVDGFLSSASPYFDESMEPMAYDPELAKSLLQQAGWDSKKELKFLVNADDSAFVNAAQIMLQQWEAVGLKVKMQTLDLASLMSKAGSLEYDMLAVQYTYAPNDPYPDISWLLSGEGSWTGYQNAAIDKALAGTQTAKTESEIEGFYAEIGQKVQEDVPMFSAYILRAQGAVNKRLSGVKSNVYGMFNDIHLWEITE